MPGYHFLDFHTIRLEGVLVEQHEVVGALVDVKLLLRTCSDFLEVRPCLLQQDHVMKAHHKVLLLCLVKFLHSSLGLTGATGSLVRRSFARL